MKIKVITGYRDDEYLTIESEEAHKAYYLFLNPDKRGIFSNGMALIGKDIRRIVPDYNASMGWNPSHKIDTDDWNEIRKNGIDKNINLALEKAKDIAYLMTSQPDLGAKKLSQIEGIKPLELPANVMKKI